MLTTHSDKEFITEMITTGVAGYVLKNTTQTELKRAIKGVAAGGKYYSSEVQESILNSYVENIEAAKNKPPEIILTMREIEIVGLLAKEYTNEKIASTLNISYRTVETHRKNIMQKTNSKNLAGLLKFAYEKGLLK